MIGETGRVRLDLKERDLGASGRVTRRPGHDESRLVVSLPEGRGKKMSTGGEV